MPCAGVQVCIKVGSQTADIDKTKYDMLKYIDIIIIIIIIMIIISIYFFIEHNGDVTLKSYDMLSQMVHNCFPDNNVL